MDDRHFKVLFHVAKWRWPGPFSYWLLIFPLGLGSLLTAILGALPWGGFYLMRWVARGFRL